MADEGRAPPAPRGRRGIWIAVAAFVAGFALAAAEVTGGAPAVLLPAAAAVVAGLALLVSARLRARRRQAGLRGPGDVEAHLGLATLGVVPVLPGQEPHRDAMGRERSPYAEAVRAVLEAAEATLPGRERPKVLLVTSSLPGEGKTTLALSLAALAARSGRVLVIDLDLRQPNVHRKLGGEAPVGIVEYVAGERALDEVIRHDAASGVDYLPVAERTTDPTELVESERLRELLIAARARYDHVVIDSAPVGLITDTRIVARLADRVLYVARWGQTPGSAVRDGLRQLREAGIEPAGVVLTQAPVEGADGREPAP